MGFCQYLVVGLNLAIKMTEIIVNTYFMKNLYYIHLNTDQLWGWVVI